MKAPSKSLIGLMIPPWLGILIILGFIIIFPMLFLPSPGGFEPARRTQARNDACQLAISLNAYLSEYGKLPAHGAGNANTATLMNTLAGTLANDPDNLRQIAFLNVPRAKKHKNGAEAENGLIYISGWKDSWGNDYEIRIETPDAIKGYKGEVQWPGGVVHESVIVWSKGDPAKPTDYENKLKWIKSWE